MALITVAQAASVLLVSVTGLVLSFVLFQSRRFNKYPVQVVATVTGSVSVWLLVNVFADRTIDSFWFEVASKVSHTLPQFILILFIVFLYLFPPQHRVNYWLVGFLICLATVVTGFIVVQKGGFTSLEPGLPAINDSGPLFYFFEFSYVALLLSICIVGFIKILRLSDARDRAVFRAVLSGFIFTTAAAIASTVLTTMVPDVFYWYYPAYLSVGVFILILGIVIFRAGALQTTFSYSRSLLVAVVISFALLGLLISP